jgi:lysyl-tRNA synthetase class 2
VTLKQQLQQRARLYQRIRAFFSRLDYLEVDTPLLSASTNTDIHIESIEARVCGQTQYLQTSPEFAMKRLLAADSGSIFQICHAFRDEEQGRRHRAEFSLLEWYSVGFDYQQLMDQVEALIRTIVGEQSAFQRLTYAQCFEQTLGLDIFNITLSELQQAVGRQISGIDRLSLSANDCLDLLISEVIAKRFEGYTFVYDYPAEQASLARISRQDSRVAERFELFYHDMELANGFSELIDAAEQRTRFEQDNARRVAAGRKPCPVDEDFLAALEQGMPVCAGVALGLDRLLMVLQAADSITQVNTPF